MVIKVGELGINHNGDMTVVRDLINVAKGAGLDYVKFQTRDISLVYSQEELDKPRESPWGTTNREQKLGLELSLDDYRRIDDYCREVGIKWFSSPWDTNSAELLASFGPDYIKVPSALLTYHDYLLKLKEIGTPLVVATGMSTLAEIDNIVDLLDGQIAYLLHCTSTYPCVSEEINLAMISSLQKRYPQYRIGFSNHSTGIIFIVMAAGLDAEMVEFHITMDRAMYGSDQAASIEPEGIMRVCKYLKHIELAKGDGIKRVYDSEKAVLDKLRRY